MSADVGIALLAFVGRRSIIRLPSDLRMPSMVRSRMDAGQTRRVVRESG